MPIIKSAKKRVKVARKAAARNVRTKRALKSALKNFQAAVHSGKKVSDAHSKAQSALATAAKKNVMHKNKVARKQRQLAAAAKAVGAKVQKPAKPAAKKAAPKRTTTKTAVKKTTAKKTVKK